MKRLRENWVWMLGLALAVVVLVVVLVFIFAFFGNPVSHLLASRTARLYQKEHYPTYTVESTGYNFKNGNYYAHLTDPSQVDGDFSLEMSPGGKLVLNTYEDRVLSGENTRHRLSMEYRDLCRQVLETEQAGLPLDFGFGDLEIWHREALGNHDCPDYALVTEDLVPNGVYDVRELGAQAGHLVYYLQVKSPSVEELAHWLLEIRRLMDQAGVPFVSIDVDLRYLRNEDGTRPSTDIRVNNFPYVEIYADGLVERVTATVNARGNDYNEIGK